MESKLKYQLGDYVYWINWERGVVSKSQIVRIDLIRGCYVIYTLLITNGNDGDFICQSEERLFATLEEAEQLFAALDEAAARFKELEALNGI